MAIQMTRAEYAAKYGAPAPAAAPVQMTRAEYAAKYGAAPEAPVAPKTGIMQKVLDAGTSVANFFGAKGISEQYGADLARATAPADAKENVSYPSMKQVLGSL